MFQKPSLLCQYFLYPCKVLFCTHPARTTSCCLIYTRETGSFLNIHLRTMSSLQHNDRLHHSQRIGVVFLFLKTHIAESTKELKIKRKDSSFIHSVKIQSSCGKCIAEFRATTTTMRTTTPTTICTDGSSQEQDCRIRLCDSGQWTAFEFNPTKECCLKEFDPMCENIYE